MSKVLTKTFPAGGVHPSGNKLSAKAGIIKLPIPPVVFIPLLQHIGASAVPMVNLNDKVKAGQLIAKSQGFISANIHSSVSGTVTKIDDIADITGYSQKAIVIKVQGDEWSEETDKDEKLKTEITLNSQEIIARIKDFGIVGLGGATFPSYVKLTPPEGKKIETLVVNGVECEPYLTADHRLMLEKSQEIIVGIRVVLKALNIEKAIIGIENNKIDAIQQLQKSAEDYPNIEVVGLRVHYPQGAERQLVKSVTNREIPPLPSGLPIDVGSVVLNVGTIFAIYEAVQKNKPLVERIVTVTGKSLKTPSNFKVRIGTPIIDLINELGGIPSDTGKIIGGGPMMGRAIANLNAPITKGMSGILLIKQQESSRQEVLNCIRCAKCVSACPLGLQPYLLMTLVEKSHLADAEKEKVASCCECGCCSYICPSSRPLLDHIRLGKTIVMNKMRSRNHNE